MNLPQLMCCFFGARLCRRPAPTIIVAIAANTVSKLTSYVFAWIKQARLYRRPALMPWSMLARSARPRLSVVSGLASDR